MTVATDASLDKEAFDPTEIRTAVDEILTIAGEIWDGNGEPSQDRSDAAVIVSWARPVAARLGRGVRLTRSRVGVLRVVNRPGQLEDRIELRISLRLRMPKDHPRGFGDPRSLSTELRWTLGREDRSWRLLAVDAAALTDEILNAPLIPGAWADEDRLWEEALAELADADAPPGHVHLRELVSADVPVADQLSQISVLDRRFDRDLVLARLRRIVEAWEESTTGSEDLLADVASEGAVQMLLYGPPRQDRLRLILHDARIDRWTPVKLDLAAAPQIHLAMVVSAVRYLVRDSTRAWASGDIQARHHLEMEWILTLYRDPGARWQLTSTSSPITPRSEPDPAEVTEPAPTGASDRERPELPLWVSHPFSAAAQRRYSQPPPSDGRWTGRADQSYVLVWLTRRRELRARNDKLREP